MELLSKVGRYEFLSEPFHCDFSSHLFMGHLGNHLLNAADFHSNDRGYGMNYLMPRHRTWVLSRLAIEMTEMPKSYDKFAVETWVENAMKYFTARDFKICGISQAGEEEKVYGYGKSVWAMIDTQSRQPVDIFSINDGLISQYIETEKECPIAASSRVKMSADAQLVRTIDTYYNDVDVNGHINSVKYIEHILDLFDLDYYKAHFLQRFEIAYVAESHQGDKLNFYMEEVGENEYCIKVTKSLQNSEKDIEVVIEEAKMYDGIVLIMDEIHRLNRSVEEILYPAMEDFAIDIVTGKGQMATSYHLPLPKFTLVGATTRAGQLTAPLRDRFGVILRLEIYTPEELSKIIKRSASILNIEIEEDGAIEIASRSRGTPRIANRLLKRVRDFAQIMSNGVITYETAKVSLNKLEIDELGLDSNDRRMLEALIKFYNGGPVGVETLAAAIGEEAVTIEDVYEPYLMQIGFLQRTLRGRVATHSAYLHLGIDDPNTETKQQNLFND